MSSLLFAHRAIFSVKALNLNGLVYSSLDYVLLNLQKDFSVKSISRISLKSWQVKKCKISIPKLGFKMGTQWEWEWVSQQIGSIGGKTEHDVIQNKPINTCGKLSDTSVK